MQLTGDKMNKDLKKAIKKAGTQSELARQLGLHRQFINQMTKDIRPIPKEVMFKIWDFING
jgi:DNA-binding transcriptional regulator YdaS (Cro superfamily)